MTLAYERRWETRGERRRGAGAGAGTGTGTGTGGRSAGDEARASYYGISPVHKPHWKWLIIVYFFLGGISGASYAVASIAQLLGGDDNRRIARAGRYLSLAALLPSPVLLILDLGRPERFLYMLRVVKLRSPMSVGTWALTVFGAFCTLSAAIQAAEDGLLGRRGPGRLLRALPARGLGVLGAVPGFFVAGYTGVLLAATAVPLWTKCYTLLGPLFLASAMSNATAALALALSLFRGHHGALVRLERLDRICIAAELALMLLVRQRLGPVIRRPMEQGRLGLMHRAGVIGLGLVTPLALQTVQAVWGGSSRAVTALASALVLAGGFMFRYVIVMAGRASADDPEATFELTRGPGSRPRQS